MKMMIRIWVSLAVFALSTVSCRNKTTSAQKSDASDATQLKTANLVGTWETQFKYPDSVQGAHKVSGYKAQIATGTNVTSDYPGQVKCNLVVKGTDHYYNAASLPGGDGKTFNPCELIVSVLKVFPYKGNAVQEGDHPRGGHIKQFFDGDGSMKGFVFTGPKVGTEIVSINGGAPLIAVDSNSATPSTGPAPSALPTDQSADPQSSVGP